MQTSFEVGEIVAAARISQWNVVRLIRTQNGYRLSRNNLENLGHFDKLEKAVDAFERATSGVAKAP
jgi:hypothetical protein